MLRFGCFSPRASKDDEPRQLSRAETVKEKKLAKQRGKLERARSVGPQGVGFSFSGAGFLFPYFAGVGASLVQLGLITSSTHLAGASAGSLIAANITSGMSPERGFEQCLAFANDCRNNGSKGRLKQALRQHLLDNFPEDVHAHVSGRTHVAVTQAMPLKRRVFSKWESKEDLVDCLVASCHLPRYSDDSLTSPYRGKAHMDGGVLNFIPAIPVPGVRTVGVCCFPGRLVERMPVKASIKRLSICPDQFEPHAWTYTLKQLMAYAFDPGSDEFLHKLYERGRRDAALWADSMGLAPGDPVADNKLDPAPVPGTVLPPSPPLVYEATTTPKVPPPSNVPPSSIKSVFSIAGLDSKQADPSSPSSSMQTAPGSSMQLGSTGSSSSQIGVGYITQSSSQTLSGPASMLTSSEQPLNPSSTRSDATTSTSLPSAAHHPDSASQQPSPASAIQAARGASDHPNSPFYVDAKSADAKSAEVPRMWPSSTLSISSAASSSCAYSEAQSVDVAASSRGDGGLPHSSGLPDEALGAGNPYRAALEVVNSLNSPNVPLQPSLVGSMGQADAGSLVSQVMQEEREAARCAADSR